MIVQAVANIPMQEWKTQKTGQPTTCSYLTGLMTPLHFPVQTIEELHNQMAQNLYLISKNKTKINKNKNLWLRIKPAYTDKE